MSVGLPAEIVNSINSFNPVQFNPIQFDSIQFNLNVHEPWGPCTSCDNWVATTLNLLMCRLECNPDC